MGQLLIKRVKYSGDYYHYESPELVGGLNILEGKNGHGKSTFMNLIYFGLSGKVDEFTQSNKETHPEIVKDKNNCVTIELEINQTPYAFVRYINSNDITVISKNGDVKVYPIIRSKNEKEVFSDWILEVLGFEPIEVYQGLATSRINFKDLLRLIYYNQELDPKKIYKPSDSENFISDSELIRKIIFELLVGKTYSEYYSTFAKFKAKERDRNVAKGLLEEFDSFAQQFDKKEDLNIIFLNKEKAEKEAQLEKLYLYRDSLKESQKPKSQFSFQINELKNKILSAELEKTNKTRILREVIDELTQLNQLKENVILEVTQISKIIHAHEKLSLFSADTCPYCLREVERTEGHCVCGKTIKEEEYERFFYSSDEYSDILKSKQKSTETINVAIKSCQDQLGDIEMEIKSLNDFIQMNEVQITNWITEYDFTSNSQELKLADDKILEVRNEINILVQKIQVEEKRNVLQAKFDKLDGEYETLRAKVKTLEGNAQSDIKEKIDLFNDIYNQMIVSTVQNIRKASISYDDYMPMFDGGQYKEASASVAKRMMYFFTLLRLSLLNDDVKYPRLLLIDTPETAGVDAENLELALSKIGDVGDGYEAKDYQIILSTGVGKYPESFKDNVFTTLNNDKRLLEPKEKLDELLR